MSKVRVEVRDISVSYRRRSSSAKSIKTELLMSGKRISGKESAINRALQECSFDLYENEILGVIGRNGAGKSSLAKVVSGVIRPTEGYVRVHGRVGALIELGGAFNSEMSARENIVFYLVIQGFSRKFAESRVEEIMSWAELSGKEDEPIASFSSGMLARFSFATYTCFTPEVLIIDEVMGVGDAAFAAKSKIRIKSMLDSGAAVMLISHDTSLIESLCQRALWINGGKVRSIGLAQEVVSSYLSEV